MKRFIKLSVVLVAAAALVGFTSARAMTVNINAFDNVGIADVNGTLGLAQGDLVEIATTTYSAASIDSAFIAGQLGGAAAANALFSVWQTDTIGDGTGYDSTLDGTYGAPGGAFLGKPIYVVVFNAATIKSGDNMGVFTGYPNQGQATPSSPAGDPWVYPTSDTAGELSPDFGDITASGLVLSSGMGDVTDVNSALDGSPAVFLAKAIPEPSSIVLVLVGLVGAMGLIRRRS